jgi:FkbM family methyltransferase
VKPDDIYGLIESLKAKSQPEGIGDALIALLQHAADMELERHGAFHLEAKTIFDVGANIGNSTRWFRKNYPDAKIYSFEPVSSTFKALSENIGNYRLTFCERLALGADVGQVIMSAKPLNEKNQILAELPKKKASIERVERTTGDRYCASRGIAEIDVLKIDTEGHDLEVLIGFQSMIGDGKIKYIQVEAGMNPENPVHVNLKQFLSWLEPKGYRVSSIHSPAREKNSHVMRRSDFVFVYAPPKAEPVRDFENEKALKQTTER